MIDWISGKRKDKPLTIHFGPAVVNLNSKSYDPYITPIQNTDRNLEKARESGIHPISLQEIILQMGEEAVPNIVLFDTPRDGVSLGNHWRVLELVSDNGVGSANLQLCGPYGAYDYDIPQIDVSLPWAMFTGLVIIGYELDQQPISLHQVVEYVRKSQGIELLEVVRETILWSNEQRQLVDLSEL